MRKELTVGSPGEFADMFSKQLGVARGTVQARGHDARSIDLIPTGARGLAAVRLEGRPLVDWLFAIALNDSHAVTLTRASRRDDDGQNAQLFRGIAIADTKDLGEALDSLLADAVSGRLREWRIKHGQPLLFVNFANGGSSTEVEAVKYSARGERKESRLIFNRADASATAPCMTRFVRIEAAIFERLAETISKS